MELWDNESKKSIKQKLDTVTVWELMNNSFYIPDYQRGYRWTDFEVTKLLEDLTEYFKDDKDGKSFYCMQPLVVFYNETKSAWDIMSYFVNTKKSTGLRCISYTACLYSSSLRWKDSYISSGTL